MTSPPPALSKIYFVTKNMEKECLLSDDYQASFSQINRKSSEWIFVFVLGSFKFRLKFCGEIHKEILYKVQV